jgi:hypothetical protein
MQEDYGNQEAVLRILLHDFKSSGSKDIERRLIEFIIQMKESGMNFRASSF